jgi:hypothetical protein
VPDAFPHSGSLGWLQTLAPAVAWQSLLKILTWEKEVREAGGEPVLMRPVECLVSAMMECFNVRGGMVAIGPLVKISPKTSAKRSSHELWG